MTHRFISRVYKDPAFERALSDLLAKIVDAYQEYPDLDRRIDLFLEFIPLLKEPFLKGVRVKVGEEEFPLELLKAAQEDLLSAFERAKGKWVVAVDESQHSGEFLNSDYFYGGSLAYGLKLTQKREKEKVLAVLSSFRVPDRDKRVKESVELQTYIQNLIVAIYSLLILILTGEEVYGLFIDGPLIRSLHPFLFVTFSREELKRLFTVDPEIEEYLEEELLGAKIRLSFLDTSLTLLEFAKGGLLDAFLNSALYGAVVDGLSSRRDLFTRYGEGEFVRAVLEEGRVPGLAVYFFLLRFLFRICQKRKVLLCGVVKASHTSKEFLRFYFIRAFGKLFHTSRELRLSKLYASSLLSEKFSPERGKTFKELLKRGELHTFFVEELGFTDDRLLTFVLDYSSHSANFTSPFEIRRFRGRGANRREVYEADREFPVYLSPYGSADEGFQEEWLEEILLKNLFPQPDYSLLMGWVRTSDLKFPLRIEFPAFQRERFGELATFVYLSSSFYRDYGIPIFMRYVDQLVRVSTDLVQRLTKGLIREKVLKGLFAYSGSAPVNEVVKSLFFNLKRDFYSR